MKITSPRASTSGSTLLLVTLVTTALIGFALAAYLRMMSSQNRTTVASMAWNKCMAIVEAGIEDAMAHINHNGLENLNRDGWVESGTKVYTITRYLGDCYYSVTISNVASVPLIPVIVATGYVPTRLSGWPSGPNALATIDNASTRTAYTKRSVMVTALADSMFPSGMVSKDGISWNGNIFSDSFDSTDPTYSSNRRYDPAKKKDGGSVGANSGNIVMGGGKIYGTVNTGPSGTVSGGSVGDAAWLASNTGIQPGHYLNTMNYSFSKVQPPFKSGDVVFTTMPAGGNLTLFDTNTITTSNTIAGALTVPSGYSAIATNKTTLSAVYPTGTAYPVVATNICEKIKGDTVCTTNWYHTSFTYVATSSTNIVSSSTDNYDAIFEEGNYQFTSWTDLNKLALIKGNVNIYVIGDVKFTGKDGLKIAVGGSLNLYVGGALHLGGNGIVNANVDSTKCAIWGLDTCTDIDFGGNASFTGTIYAPEATYKAGGGGSDQYDVVGSVVVKDVKMNGHFSFHYDEALGKTGLADGYKINSWKEISSTSYSY